MGIESIVTGIFGLIPSIFKHKPNVIWYWSGEKWEMIGGPMSSRQCRLQIKTFVSYGMDGKRFIILRAGIKPPGVFNPPATGEKS